MSFLAYFGVAYRHALPGTRRPWIFGVFLVANLLFYAHLRLAVVRLGHLYELAGQTEWRVTPRSVADADGDDAVPAVVPQPRLELVVTCATGPAVPARTAARSGDELRKQRAA
jgi:hypothetical protein